MDIVPISGRSLGGNLIVVWVSRRPVLAIMYSVVYVFFPLFSAALPILT